MNKKQETIIRRLKKMPKDEFEGIVAALKFYDAELGRLERRQNVPFGEIEYRRYLEDKCSNLQTQCRILYNLLGVCNE